MCMVTEIVAILKDITLMACAIVGAYVARKGLATWKRQLDGNARYTNAKNLIITIYELRSGVASVRVPLMEFSPTENENDKKVAEWKGLCEAYQKRWERVTAPQDKLNVLLLECAAIHGEDFLELERKQLQIFLNELYLEIRKHLDCRNPNRQASTHDNIKILFGMNDETDEFFCRLARIIKQFEAKLRPHIQEFHTK
jgi:hypothetical protein